MDVLKSARVFLEGAMAISKPEVASLIRNEIETLLGGEKDELDESEVAGVTFTLEQQFAKLPDLAVKEEIVARMNIFKTAFVRRQLATSRQMLQDAEATGDDDMFASALETIKILEAKLKERPYTAEHLGA
jgi:hypothetical protein